MVKLMKEERTKQIRLGKRKVRESEDSGSGMRGWSGERERSFTVTTDLDSRSFGRGVSSNVGGSASVRTVPGRGKAIRGGMGGARFL